MAPNTSSSLSKSSNSEMDLYSSSNLPSVVVIGSGFAGLAAARTLQEASFKVIVLESRDRIGGRAHTNYSLGFPLDMGASWLHGVNPANPLANVIGKLNLPMYRTSGEDSVLYDHDLESYVLYDKNGNQIPSDLVLKIEKHFEELLEETKLLRTDINEDTSMEHAFLAVYKKRPELKLHGVEESVFQWYVCRMEGWFATDLDKLSLLHWDEENLFEGGHGLLTQGYYPALEHLSKGLDIRLDHRVNEIEWDSEGGVRIRTENKQVFSADAAVVTIPVGVLKTDAVRFVPHLPAWKRTTIAGLGFGNENKIALLFESAFWPHVEFVGVVAPTSYECGYFLNLFKATGNPVLVFMPAGQLAHDLEELSDESVVDFAMKQLRHVIPSAPDPRSYLVTRWGSDPHCLGSYSFEMAGGPSHAYDSMLKPVDGRLFFAGEACSKQYQGTVHGAYDTGVCSANKIKKMFNTLATTTTTAHSELQLFAPACATEAAAAAEEVTEEETLIPVTLQISRI